MATYNRKDYATALPQIEKDVGEIKKTVPTKTSDLTNDSGFVDESELDDYLPLSGGTLTGALNGTSGTFSGNVDANTHTTKVDSIDQATTPSSNQSQNVLVSHDKYGIQIGVAYSIQRSTGEIGFAFGAFRTINDTDYTNYIISEIKDDGTRAWRFTDSTSFIDGLGLGNAIRPSAKATTGWGFSANQSRSGLTIPVTSVSGYTPYVYFAYCHTHSAVDVIDASISGTTLTFWARNRSADTLTNVGFTFRIFYIKNSVLGASVSQ